VRRRGWGLVLVVLATLGGLALVGRVQDLPEDPGAAEGPAASTRPTQVASAGTLAPGRVPEGLGRPLRLPSPRRDGSCPTSPAVGPPRTRANPVASVAVGDGPVYPVLFRAAGGRLDRSAVAYWDAPEPLGGPAIVRGHRLGAPGDRVRFVDDDQRPRPVHVLDPALAHDTGAGGHWWRPTRLRAGAGCYGFQIDGPRFTQVVVVELA
jgi:hypothetical protein